jgi:serine/threonine protein kinase
MTGPAGKGSLLAKRYRLLGSLGRGGMGIVWQARDEVLGREVAVKEVLLPPELPEDERAVMRERTLREARSAARLSHPNVVTVYDVVEEDGRPWIVMELVRSRTLAQAIRDDGVLPWREVAGIGVQVLAALQAAHAAGVLHRDVKPSNVLLAEDGRVVLTDFGIASLEGETTLTRTGMLVGSPAFIAPERVRARGAGPESDLWSLGATLYTAVEGRPPHDRGGALPTLTAAVTEAPDPAPSAGPLWPAIDGLLRKEPAERIDARETGRLLRQALDTAGQQPAVAPAAGSTISPDSGQRTSVLPVPPQIDTEPPSAGTPSVGAAPAPAAGTPLAGASYPVAGTPLAAASPPAAGTPLAGASPAAADGPPPGAPSAVPDAGPPVRRVTLAVLACLVVVGAVVGWVLRPTDNDPGNQSPQAGGSSSTAPPSTRSSPSATRSSPSATTSKPATATSKPPATTSGPPPTAPPATGVPAGFRRHTDSTGFSLVVPEGWTVGRDGQQVSFREPGGSRRLLIDQTDQPKADPVADWRQQEQVRRDGYADYRRIRIEAVDYFVKAADWEFTYAAGSGRQHVLIRGVVTSDDQAYGIYWSTPESQWPTSRAVLRTITDSFRPAP